MLPPNYLSYCTDEIEEIYSKLDTRITQDIVRRIIKTGEITDTAKWQVKMAQESGLLYDDIVQMVVESTGETEKAVKLLFEDAGIQATMIDYEKAGALQRVDKLSPSALQILEAAIKKTNSSLSNLTMTTAEMAQNAFISACSMAEMEITSGAFDANTAIKHAVDMSIEEGNRIRYPSGVTRSVEAAVRTAVLTGVSQTTGHISLANAEALGTDIMQLSAHGGARPEHAVWQGKLVCISNKRRRGYLSLKDIGYGEITGFKGINCTHDWYPFIVGVSKRAYTKKELEEINNQTVTYNGKEMPLYEAQDLQRAMERKIRDERRQLASYDTAIKNTKDKTLKQEFQGEFDMLSVKLKSHEAKYRDFSNQTGMRPQTERLQVSGFGRSVSQKATNANKTLVNYAKEYYNTNDEDDATKMFLRDKKTRVWLRSSRKKKVIEKGKQEKHIKGSNNYIEGRSYLTITLDEAQDLVNEYAGTGWLYRTADNRFANKELIEVDKLIGVCVTEEQEIPTNKFKIHYSKKGTHIVPFAGGNNG